MFETVQIDKATAETIARGLCTLAEVDGMVSMERALIEAFWAETTGGTGPVLALQNRTPIPPSALAEGLRSDEQKALFLRCALLLCWADGEVSPEERETLRGFQQELGIDGAALDKIEDSVMEYLGAHISHIESSEAAQLIERKIKERP
jgi:tellurite resistance protein